MGLYDGAVPGVAAGSTASVALLLKAPVILVVDASASAESAAAMALGFREYDRRVRVAGVMANRIASSRHAAMVARGLASVGIPFLGAIARDEGLALPEGRLGLLLSGNRGDGQPQAGRHRPGSLEGWVARAGAAVAQGVDLEAVLRIARSAPPLSPPREPVAFSPDLQAACRPLRIAVARDEAFWFYYPDALDWLQFAGVELLPFSPLRDKELPQGAHGLWMGGGFPERYGEELAANGAMREAVRTACRQGLPIYAEGGGFQYLLTQLVVGEASYPMAGCFAGRSVMENRLQGLGYRRAEAGGNGTAMALGSRGATVRGHVFHYSRAEGLDHPPAWRLYRANGEFEREDGLRTDAAVAGYLHVHFPSQPAVAQAFLDRCRMYARRREGAPTDA